MAWIQRNVMPCFTKPRPRVLVLIVTITCTSFKVNGFEYPCEVGVQYVQKSAENGRILCKDCTICQQGFGTTKYGECFGLNDTQCRQCVRGQEYSLLVGVSRECLLCGKCSRNQIAVHQCNVTHNAVCACKAGYHFDDDVYGCVSSGNENTPFYLKSGIFQTTSGYKVFEYINVTTSTVTTQTSIIFTLLGILLVAVIAIIVVILIKRQKIRCKKKHSEPSDEANLLEQPRAIEAYSELPQEIPISSI